MAQANYVIQLTVVNDGTLTNETRLGAIGDIQYVIDQEDVADDLLILASDNLFEFELSVFVNFAKKYNSDALAMYHKDDINQLKRNGTASFDDNDAVTDSIEKPENPSYHYCVPTFYVLKETTLPLIKQYLNEGNNPDVPGNFIPYFILNKKVKAFVFVGKRYDIGAIESYNKVQEILKYK